jgi:hypothetical protein
MALDEFDALAHRGMGGNSGKKAQLIGAEAEGGEDLGVFGERGFAGGLEDEEIELGAASKDAINEFGDQGGILVSQAGSAGFEGRIDGIALGGGH